MPLRVCVAGWWGGWSGQRQGIRTLSKTEAVIDGGPTPQLSSVLPRVSPDSWMVQRREGLRPVFPPDLFSQHVLKYCWAKRSSLSCSLCPQLSSLRRCHCASRASCPKRGGLCTLGGCSGPLYCLHSPLPYMGTARVAGTAWGTGRAPCASTPSPGTASEGLRRQALQFPGPDPSNNRRRGPEDTQGHCRGWSPRR